jgi:hypothetical protein
MLCSACGKQVDDRSGFCSSCGTPVAIAAPRSKTNPIVIIVVAVVAVFGILVIGGIALALATPNLGKARMSAEEMSAIHNIRTICAAQVQYYLVYSRYATSLSELGPPSDGKPGPSFADLLPANLAAGSKGGYTYTLKGQSHGLYRECESGQIWNNRPQDFFLRRIPGDSCKFWSRASYISEPRTSSTLK